MSTYSTASPAKTKGIAASLAKNILKTKSKDKAVVIALTGELGSGKTTFLQGFAEGLGIKEKILSPTFVLMKKFIIYDSPKHGKFAAKQTGFKNFYHIDCYRTERPKEILELGFKRIVSDCKNIVAVEWPERIKAVLPKGCLIVKFEFVSRKQRRITIQNSCGKLKFLLTSK